MKKRKGSMAGTSLASGLTRMIKPSKEAKKVMDKYGISIQKNEEGQVDLMKTMEHLREKLGGLTTEQKAQAVSTIFGLTAMKGWLPIINATAEDFDKLKDAIYNSGGASSEIMKEMEKSGAYTFKILLSNIQDFLISVGDAFAPAMMSIAKWLTEVTGKLSEWVQKMQETSPETLELIGKLTLLGLALPPIITAIGFLGQGFSTLTGLASTVVGGIGKLKGKLFELSDTTIGAKTNVFRLIGAFMKTPAGITVAVASLGLIATAVGTNTSALDWLQDKWGNFGYAIGNVCERVSGVVQMLFGTIGVGVETAGKTIGALLTGNWKDIERIQAEGSAKMSKVMAEATSNAGAETSKALKNIKNATSEELGQIERVWKYSMDRLPNLTYDNLDKTSNLFGKMLAGVDDEMFTTLRGTSETMSELLYGINEDTADKGKVIRENLENMLLNGSTTPEKLQQDLKKTMGLVNENMANSSTRFSETVQGMFNELSQTSKYGAESVATNLVSNIQKMDDDTLVALTRMGGSWKAIFDGITTDGSQSTEYMTKLITNRIKDMANENPNFIATMKDEMLSYLSLLKEQGVTEVGALDIGIAEKMANILLSTDGIGQEIVDNLDISDASEMTEQQLSILNSMLSQSGLEEVSMEEGRKIVDGILTNMKNLPTEAGTVIDETGVAISDKTTSLEENMYETGTNLTENLNQGISDNVGVISGSTGEIENALSSIDSVQLGNVTKQLSNIRGWLQGVAGESNNTANSMKNLTNLPFGNTTKGLQQTSMWLQTVKNSSTTTRSSMIGLTNLPFGNTTKGLSEVDKWLKTVERASSWTRKGLKGITEITYGKVTKGLSEVDKWLVAGTNHANNLKVALVNMSNVRFGGLVSSVNNLVSALNRVKSVANTTKSAINSVSSARSSLSRMAVPTPAVAMEDINPMARVQQPDMSKFKTSGGWYAPTQIAGYNNKVEKVETSNNNDNLVKVLLEQNQLLMSLLTADRNINVSMEISGRQIAKTTAPYMESEMNSLAKKKNRMKGQY